MSAGILPRCVISFSKPEIGLGFPTEDDVSKAVLDVIIRQNSTRQDRATVVLDDKEMRFLEMFSTGTSATHTISIWLGWAEYITEVFSGWVPVMPSSSYKANGLITTTVTLSSMATQVFKPKALKPREASLDSLINKPNFLYQSSPKPERVVESHNPFLLKIEPVTFGAGYSSGEYTLGILLEEVSDRLGVALETAWKGDWPPIEIEVQEGESLREFIHRMSQKYLFRYRFVQIYGEVSKLYISPLGTINNWDSVDYSFHYFKGIGTKKLMIPYPEVSFGASTRLLASMTTIRERSCVSITGFSVREGSARSKGLKVATNDRGELLIYKDGYWYRLNKEALDAAEKRGELLKITGKGGLLSLLGTREAYIRIEPYLIREKIPADAAQSLMDGADIVSNEDQLSFEASCVAEILGDPSYQPGMLNSLYGIHGIWSKSIWQSEDVQHRFSKGTYMTQSKIRTVVPINSET